MKYGVSEIKLWPVYSEREIKSRSASQLQKVRFELKQERRIYVMNHRLAARIFGIQEADGHWLGGARAADSATAKNELVEGGVEGTESREQPGCNKSQSRRHPARVCQRKAQAGAESQDSPKDSFSSGHEVEVRDRTRRRGEEGVRPGYHRGQNDDHRRPHARSRWFAPQYANNQHYHSPSPAAEHGLTFTSQSSYEHSNGGDNQYRAARSSDHHAPHHAPQQRSFDPLNEVNRPQQENLMLPGELRVLQLSTPPSHMTPLPTSSTSTPLPKKVAGTTSHSGKPTAASRARMAAAASMRERGRGRKTAAVPRDNIRPRGNTGAGTFDSIPIPLIGPASNPALAHACSVPFFCPSVFPQWRTLRFTRCTLTVPDWQLANLAYLNSRKKM
ncbi:hypothetical protein B0H13DRAFT_1852050 [Mycena leptocephala]|nr:hypothetical protein B0H13DRAFT_1852050 [Mycena leptocephala]